MITATVSDDRILPYLVTECVITLDLWYTHTSPIDVAEHAKSLSTDLCCLLMDYTGQYGIWKFDEMHPEGELLGTRGHFSGANRVKRLRQP